MTVHPLVCMLKKVTALALVSLALRRSPTLLIILELGAWGAMHQKQCRILGLEASIAQLSEKIADGEAKMREMNLQVATLERMLAKQEAGRGGNPHNSHNLEATDTKPSLVERLAKARGAVAKSPRRVEGPENRLTMGEAIARSKDAPREGATQNVKWREEADSPERELACALDRLQRMLSEDKEFVDRIQEDIISLERRCEGQMLEIRCLTKENEALQTEVDKARAEDLILEKAAQKGDCEQMATCLNEKQESDGTNGKEPGRYGKDIQVRSLLRELGGLNEVIWKAESRVVELEAELLGKDARVRYLSQATQGIESHVAKGGQKAPQSNEGSGPPDWQTCAQYEGKIAELTDKLSEAHRLLKAGLNDPSGLKRSSLLTLSVELPGVPPTEMRGRLRSFNCL